jgi:uncharacterized protein (TIGR01244 family)
MRLRILFLAFAGHAVASAAHSQTDTDDPLAKEIPNYVRPAGTIAFSGQPAEETFKKLKEAGYKTILNLRPADELSFDEKKVVEELGMTYVNIPITTFSITDEKVSQFTKVVGDSANKPLLIHCGSSNRVGGLWYIYRALTDKVPEEESLEEATAFGLRSLGLKMVVLRYVDQRK